MPIAEISPRPQFRPILEDGRVVEEREYQVVPNQILAGAPQIERVPVLELLPHHIQLLLGDGDPLIGPIEEDVVPHLVIKLFRLDS